MFDLDLGNAESPNGDPMGEQTVKEVSNTEGVPEPLTVDLNRPDTAQPQGGDTQHIPSTPANPNLSHSDPPPRRSTRSNKGIPRTRADEDPKLALGSKPPKKVPSPIAQNNQAVDPAPGGGIQSDITMCCKRAEV